jgi:hypothetical protein
MALEDRVVDVVEFVFVEKCGDSLSHPKCVSLKWRRPNSPAVLRCFLIPMISSSLQLRAGLSSAQSRLICTRTSPKDPVNSCYCQRHALRHSQCPRSYAIHFVLPKLAFPFRASTSHTKLMQKPGKILTFTDGRLDKR